MNTFTGGGSCSSTSSFAHKTLIHPSILTCTNNNHHFDLSNGRISFSSWSRSTTTRRPFPRIFCSSPGSGPSGESDNKTVLDAFFLGRALGEALTERVESTVGEILSSIGRLQSEQQKQVREFQEDVLERAKRGKEKAAREALQEKGRLIPSSTKANASVSRGYTSSTSPPASSSPTLDDDQNSGSSVIDEERSDEGINID